MNEVNIRWYFLNKMEWNDTVIILRTGDFRESDLWLRLCSPKRGIYTAFAFGGRRSRRRFCGCLDIFNILACRCKTSKNAQFQYLEEAVLLKGPQLLRAKWERMGLAVNCARFTEAMNITGDTAKPAFNLYSELLDCLEKETAVFPLMPFLFRLRLVSDIGFAPDFSVCSICGNTIESDAYFYFDAGRLRCMSCAHTDTPYTEYLTDNSIKLLRDVQKTPVAAWEIENLSSNEQKSTARAIDGFLQYHVGLVWSNGTFKRV